MIFVDIAIFSAFPNVQLLDCAITRYYYPVVSHFIKALVTSNQTISPGQILLHFPLIIILELNPCSENSLRRVQNLSQPKFVITTAERFKDFLACRIAVSSKHQYPVNIQRFFRLQKCLSSKSLTFRKFSKTFLACRVVLAANHQYPGKIQRFFCLQNCLCRKSSISRKYSKTYWPAELSQPQVISIPKIFEYFFACRVVLTANHQYPGNIRRIFRQQNCLSLKSSVSRNIQRLFRLQSCLSRKSSISGNYSKTFFACRIVVAANHQYPGKIQRLFRLQNSTRSKSSKSRKYLQIFSPVEMSRPQIINILKKLKDLLACRVVLAENHQYPGTIQKLFCLQNWLNRKSPISRKYSKTFSPAEMSQPQIINIRELFKSFFACRIGIAANHQYPGNFQRLFRLQSCLSRKSSISGNYSKTFLPVELAQPQITNILKVLEDSFACRFVLAANH